MLRRVLAGVHRHRARRPAAGPRAVPALRGARETGPGAGPGPVPSFSLTHSGDMVIVAVAGRPVGVDVEREAAGCVCSLAQALHPADAAWVAGLGEPDRHEAIITCWVRAEAVLKSPGRASGTASAASRCGRTGPWATRRTAARCASWRPRRATAPPSRWRAPASPCCGRPAAAPGWAADNWGKWQVGPPGSPPTAGGAAGLAQAAPVVSAGRGRGEEADMTAVFAIDACRTPVGKIKGSLAPVRPIT